jgi:nitrite reductase (NADH) small subunit
VTTTTEKWVLITPVGNVPLREGRSVAVDGREVAIFNLGDRFVAMENRCPHKGGPLADGIVSATGEEITVTCPLHNWRVGVDGGRVVKPSCDATLCVRTYPVTVENGIIAIRVA